MFARLRNEEWLTGGVYGHPRHRAADVFGLADASAVDFYWFALAIAAVDGLRALWWMVRSPWGRAFTALRENPMRAESLGVDVRRYTLLAFAIGSAYGGIAGASTRRWSSSSTRARSRSDLSLLFC